MSLDVSQLALFAAETEEAAGGVSALGIDIARLVFQLITFVIVFLILRRFAFEPILKALEQRRKTINEGLANADKVEKRLAETQKETEAMLKEARTEVETIIAKGHEEAGAVVAAAEEAAAQKAEKLIADAQKKLESDITKATSELRKEMLQRVSEATEIVIDEKLDAEKDHELLARALSGDRR